jgi:hypothetical protein
MAQLRVAVEEQGKGGSVMVAGEQEPRSPERVVVLVDGPQVAALRVLIGGRDINPGLVLKFLVGRRTLVRAAWYQAFNPEDQAAIKFLIDFVASSRLYDLVMPGRRDHDIDADLVSDLLETAFEGQADTIVLVSGDGGYLRPMRIAQKRGIRVEVASTLKLGDPPPAAIELRREADLFIELGDHIDRITSGQVNDLGRA